MDPHLPFLKAIAADPADDLPRLVYADFLEETGEPVHVARAHFIRTQIALESLPPRTREYREAKALEGQLREMFMEFWLLDQPAILRPARQMTWRRGFPHVIRLALGYSDDEVWLTPAWFELRPICGIQLEQMWGPGVINWTSRLRWTQITHLQLGPNFVPFIRDDDQETQVFLDLMSFTGFTTLRSLNLSGNRLTDRWLVRFVSQYPAASFAATLEELDFSNCHNITDAGANTLATARGLDRLKVLRLKGVTLSPAAMSMLRRRFGNGLQI
jgi:uncharacterized protein (TIGR02996 family)